jgi:hypothetical protein
MGKTYPDGRSEYGSDKAHFALSFGPVLRFYEVVPTALSCLRLEKAARLNE